MSDNRYNNVLISGVWLSRSGNLSTLPIDAKAYDALVRSVEQGGKFLIRKRTEEAMSKSKNPETTPQYYLEFIPKEEVEKFSADKERQRGL